MIDSTEPAASSASNLKLKELDAQYVEYCQQFIQNEMKIAFHTEDLQRITDALQQMSKRSEELKKSMKAVIVSSASEKQKLENNAHLT